MKYLAFALLAVLTALLPPIESSAQTRPSPVGKDAPAPKPSVVPRTSWGDPDLQGTWTSDDCVGTPIQRPANFGDRLYLNDQELAQRESQLARQVEDEKRESVPRSALRLGPPREWQEHARRPCKQTSLVADPPNGRIPDLTAEARTRRILLEARDDDPMPASWEDFSPYIRCITRGVTGSIFPTGYGNGAQIVQAPGFVTILHEMIHEARVIPLDGRPHAGPNIRTYMGDSRGHWEGNTLVIETTNFLGNTGIGQNGGGTPTSDALKLTERYTRTDTATIRYEVTIDDPKTYTRPWKVTFPITQEPGYQNFEYACHEGNYAMADSLSAARAQETKAAEQAGKKR